jgi:hypothetical protein
VWRCAVHCAVSDKREEDARKKAGNGGTKIRSDTTRFQTARPLPGKVRISNGALEFLLGLGLGDKKLCLDHGFHTGVSTTKVRMLL